MILEIVGAIQKTLSLLCIGTFNFLYARGAILSTILHIRLSQKVLATSHLFFAHSSASLKEEKL